MIEEIEIPGYVATIRDMEDGRFEASISVQGSSIDSKQVFSDRDEAEVWLHEQAEQA